MDSLVVYLAGRFVDPSEASISLLDRGYLVGEGVFATLRGYDGVCFRPHAHLGELARGAAMLEIHTPPLDALADLADEAARRTGERDAYVRVTLTAGPPAGPPTLSLLARRMDVPTDDAYANGVAAMTLPLRRIPPACGGGSVKTTSYAPQVLAKRTAGAREGIQLSIDGALACGAFSNLFVVVGERLLTPSLDTGCRAGVTRGAVLEIASALGMRVEETRLEPSILEHADEAFFTSTRIECLPIASVDGRAIGDGRFSRTRALRAALGEQIRAETAVRRTR